MACFLLLTFLPERPLLSVPDLRFFMARSTFLAAPLEYFRFLAFFAILFSLAAFPVWPPAISWNSVFR